MTDDELRDQAWAELVQTTKGYQQVKGSATYATSHWGKGEALLGKIGTAPVTAPLPSPYPVFGLSLPARLAESTFSTSNVSTAAALAAAVVSGATAPGHTINITANINGGGALLAINTQGTAANPIHITSNPGVLLTNYSQIEVKGSYTRLRGLDIGYNTIDNIKIDSTGNNIEIDSCHSHNAARQGLLVSSPANNVQVWNNTFNNNGSAVDGNLDHGTYFAYASGNCVIANNLYYDNYAYNIQIYPNSSDIIITCNTVDGGTTRGGMVIGSETGLTKNVVVYGHISTNAPNWAVHAYDPAGACSATVYDSLGFGNGSGDFETKTGYTYNNCTHEDPVYTNRAAKDYTLQNTSPAIGKVQPAQYGYIPPLDKNGNARVTADAGCFRH